MLFQNNDNPDSYEQHAPPQGKIQIVWKRNKKANLERFLAFCLPGKAHLVLQ